MPNSLTPEYLAGLAFSTAHAATLCRLGRQWGRVGARLVAAPDDLRAHLHERALAETPDAVSRLDGLVLPGARARPGAPTTGSTASARDEQVLMGHGSVAGLIHDSHEHMRLTPALICQLHQLLYRFHPDPGGRPRTHEVEGSPAPALIPGALDSLCLRYARVAREHPALVVIPLLALDLWCMRPFGRGDAAVCRLVTLLELYRAGHDVGRYVALEGVMAGYTADHAAALAAASSGWATGTHDALPWLTHFWGVLTAAYGELSCRLDELAPRGGTKAAAVERVVFSLGGTFTLSELAARLPHVSKPTMSRVLGALRDSGRVRLTGRGRAARWSVVDPAPVA